MKRGRERDNLKQETDRRYDFILTAYVPQLALTSPLDEMCNFSCF